MSIVMTFVLCGYEIYLIVKKILNYKCHTVLLKKMED